MGKFECVKLRRLILKEDKNYVVAYNSHDESDRHASLELEILDMRQWGT